jgi:long-chain acyl-CoA synthetase
MSPGNKRRSNCIHSAFFTQQGNQMRSNLASLVDDWRANGSQTAIVTYNGNRRTATTYAALAHLSERFAAELDRRQIVVGERVVLWGRNSAEWVAAFFGCVLRGVIVVPLDAAGSPEFARRVIVETEARLVTGDRILLGLLDRSVPQLSHDDFSLQLPALPKTQPKTHSSLAAVNLRRETPLQILFTSGTTAEPKGIIHTHGNVLASVEPIEREMQRYRRYEWPFHPLRFLHTLPLSHVFGQFMGLWLPPLLAAEVHFEDRLEADRLVQAIRRERITVLAAVPRMLDLLHTHLLLREDGLAQEVARAKGIAIWKKFWRFRRIHRLFGWKFWACVCGGASLADDLEQFWSTLGFAVIQGYGMTETTALVTLNHPFKIGKGTIGKPLPGREIRIGPDGEISVRGEMVATATWRQGHIEERSDPWLATGDMVSRDQDGQLRFVGRKSEIIVTSSGLNIHPEDVEAALMKQQGVSACAVVAVTLPTGEQEPVAVLLAPGGREAAANAIVAANRGLAEYQRIRRWHLWPESDLPRTSTGKVQRGKLREWVERQQANADIRGGSRVEDPLLSLIALVTGSAISHADDAATLQEDLHVDSLGRLQLQSAIEQRFGVSIGDESFLAIETLGQLRAWMMQTPARAMPVSEWSAARSRSTEKNDGGNAGLPLPSMHTDLQNRSLTYPHWPWWRAIAAMRILFVEMIVRPVVWLLLQPKVAASRAGLPSQPMLLIANHVTLFDVPLLLYALPSNIRRHMAVAAAGEMLEDWKRGRRQPAWWINVLAPLQYWLLTALFNVFPLPQQVGVRRSFAHVGEALDHGYNVLIFPEGRRSEDGKLQPFRSGIGLLAEESKTLVLPVALKGMDELVARKRRWLHAGLIEVRLGIPIPVDTTPPAGDVAQSLHEVMQTLLRG